MNFPPPLLILILLTFVQSREESILAIPSLIEVTLLGRVLGRCVHTDQTGIKSEILFEKTKDHIGARFREPQQGNPLLSLEVCRKKANKEQLQQRSNRSDYKIKRQLSLLNTIKQQKLFLFLLEELFVEAYFDENKKLLNATVEWKL